MFQVMNEDPSLANDATAQVPLGTLRVYIDPTYGFQIHQYVQFVDAVAYTAGCPCSMSATDGGYVVTTDVSEDNGVAAGIYNRVMTQNYYGWMLVYGKTLVQFNNDDDAADGAVALVSADGVADTGSDPGSLLALGIVVGAVNTTSNKALTFVKCLGV